MTTGAAPLAPVSIGSLVQLTLSLALVVGVIFVVTWLIKRSNLGMPRASRTMAVLDELALGPRERLVLVRVGEAQLLLGVGTHGVVALTPLSAPIAAPPAAVESTFAARLRDMMNRGRQE